MDEDIKLILMRYLTNNIPANMDEFREILPGASLKQLKEWREKIISSNFGIGHLEPIEEELIKIIPESTEVALILDLNQTVDLESSLGGIIETWLLNIFPEILYTEMDLNKLLDWANKIPRDYGERLLIEKQAQKILPEALAVDVGLKKLLEWQEAEVLQDAESQEMIKRQIASTLSQIPAEPDNVEELIRLRKQYKNSSFYSFIHNQLVNILPESLSKVNNIKKLTKWEAEVSQTSDVWKDDDEICVPVMMRAIKLVNGVLIYSLPFQPWFLEMAKGEIEISWFLKLPFFKKVQELVNGSD